MVLSDIDKGFIRAQGVPRISGKAFCHFDRGAQQIVIWHAQIGDPKGDGTGGSTLPNVPAEFNYYPHVRGAVSAARAEDENSANSQFFIVLQPRMQLDRKYTVFGRVIDGMQYVDAIQRGEPPATPTKILHAYIAADSPPAYTPAAATVAQPAGLAPVTLPGTTPKPVKAAPARK